MKEVKRARKNMSTNVFYKRINDLGFNLNVENCYGKPGSISRMTLLFHNKVVADIEFLNNRLTPTQSMKALSTCFSNSHKSNAMQALAAIAENHNGLAFLPGTLNRFTRTYNEIINEHGNSILEKIKRGNKNDFKENLEVLHNEILAHVEE